MVSQIQFVLFCALTLSRSKWSLSFGCRLLLIFLQFCYFLKIFEWKLRRRFLRIICPRSTTFLGALLAPRACRGTLLTQSCPDLVRVNIVCAIPYYMKAHLNNNEYSFEYVYLTTRSRIRTVTFYFHHHHRLGVKVTEWNLSFYDKMTNLLYSSIFVCVISMGKFYVGDLSIEKQYISKPMIQRCPQTNKSFCQ